jgi:serine/threonine protein kinase
LATKEKKEKENPWAVTLSIIIPFFIVFMIIGMTRDPIATVMLGVITLLIAALVYWMRSHYEYKKETVRKTIPEPQDTSEMKRMQERMENLEALICRLDSELTQQIEKSLMSRSIALSADPAVSQTPTTMLQLAGALEKRYQILQEIGRGGMGVVFQAYDKQLHEQVAVKLLSPFLSHDSEALERLKREVSSARRITHPNVIRIHDIGEAGGLHYVSMEFFAGTNLKDYVRQQGALSVMQVHQILLQLCDGLEAAHSQGIVHRDLKSQNVIVNRAGQIKIIDFGLARTAHLDGMTATGLIMGTPEYMAPEQVAGKKVDERADIYALGIMMYELLSGKVPFTGESAIAVGFKQLKDHPVSLRESTPAIPADLERIVMKALEKDPLRRYQTVRDLRQDFQKAMIPPDTASKEKRSVKPDQIATARE